MPIKYVVKISCSEEDAGKIGDQIHEQLVGNQDYANGNIELNYKHLSGDVYLFIDNIDEVPEITLFKKDDKESV